MRRFFLSLTAVLALTPLAARADALDYAGRKLDVVSHTLDAKIGALWNFLGSSLPESGTADLSQLQATPGVRLMPLPRPVDAAPAPGFQLAAADIRSPAALPAHALSGPTVERSSKKLFCVEYARALSGLNIFGDAKYWWDRARNLYARAGQPIEHAVMVFSGSPRLRSGHLAVVSDIVSPREIRVEQANWLNRGEIDHATPVLDVSAKNDWSKVRVWDVPSRTFGSRVYAISGFILKPLLREAANN